MYMKSENKKIMFFNKSVMLGKEVLFNLLEAHDEQTITAEFDTFPMSTKDIIRLAAIITTNPFLKAISLVDCCLKNDHIEVLGNAILANEALEQFHVELFEDCNEDIQVLMTKVYVHLQKNIKNSKNKETPTEAFNV